jgi:hypothetical protein
VNPHQHCRASCVRDGLRGRKAWETLDPGDLRDKWKGLNLVNPQ